MKKLTLTIVAGVPPLIMKLAMTVSPYPTFPRSREKEQTNRCASFTLMLLLCFSPFAVSDGLPDLGDVSQTVLTPLQERQIGQQSMMEIRASKQFFDDAEINDYLNQLGYKLVENSAEPSLGFEFFVLDDYNINAFAMPGGFIGVNSGLLLTARANRNWLPCSATKSPMSHNTIWRAW